jgi:D-inositol-3-phosphate glycosyltransferase
MKHISNHPFARPEVCGRSSGSQFIRCRLPPSLRSSVIPEVDVKSHVKVALLTAGRDKHYAYGMAKALIEKGLSPDIIGSDDLDTAEWHGSTRVRFFNLRGDMSENASLQKKIARVLIYYVRLILYAAAAEPKIFHILWNNKFETFDRVPLMLYYKLLGKKTILTVHNVNAGTRDSNDTWFNRLTLNIQYQLCDHLFVHTQRMKRELIEQFYVSASSISVIPYGINNAVPNTNLSSNEARQRLRVPEEDRVILFFGNIAPYKGLEYLIDAFQQVMVGGERYRLIIAGNLKDCESYWNSLQGMLGSHPNRDRIIQKIQFIPDSETEIYFKAADVLVLPYRHIFQSGVLFLGYRFGLPVIASDVGALRDEIIDGKTGFVCRPEDSDDLALVIEKYFSSDLYRGLGSNRQGIIEYAYQRSSWEVVAQLTENVYMKLLGERPSDEGCRAISH